LYQFVLSFSSSLSAPLQCWSRQLLTVWPQDYLYETPHPPGKNLPASGRMSVSEALSDTLGADSLSVGHAYYYNCCGY